MTAPFSRRWRFPVAAAWLLGLAILGNPGDAQVKGTPKDVKNPGTATGPAAISKPAAAKPTAKTVTGKESQLPLPIGAGAKLARDSSAVDSLIARLRSPDAAVRRAAATALGKLKAPRAVEALATAARDKNPGVQEAAVTALGGIDDPRATTELRALQSSGSPQVRVMSEKALKERAELPPVEQANRDYEEVVKSLSQGMVGFNPPRQMKQNSSTTIVVEVQQGLSDEIARAFRSRGLTEFDTVGVGVKMTATLKGNGFQILSLTPEDQSVTADKGAKWMWQIKALEPDTQLLVLSISTYLDAYLPGRNVAPRVETHERKILVLVQPIGRFTVFLSEWGRPIVVVGSIIGALSAIIGVLRAIVLWRRRRKQPRPPAK